QKLDLDFDDLLQQGAAERLREALKLDEEIAQSRIRLRKRHSGVSTCDPLHVSLGSAFLLARDEAQLRTAEPSRDLFHHPHLHAAPRNVDQETSHPAVSDPDHCGYVELHARILATLCLLTRSLTHCHPIVPTNP